MFRMLESYVWDVLREELQSVYVDVAIVCLTCCNCMLQILQSYVLDVVIECFECFKGRILQCIYVDVVKLRSECFT